MPAFKDLHSDAGLKALNEHLSTRSYVEGYKPSAADSALLPQLSASIDSTKYPHAARWLHHIASFPPLVRQSWSGAAGATNAVGASAKGGKPAAAPVAAAAAAEEDDDDDFMASLSDDEEDEDAGAAAQALIAKKNAEREAAKRALKGGPTAKSSLILDIKPEDSETDMNELLQSVKQIEMEGLTWGGHEVGRLTFTSHTSPRAPTATIGAVPLAPYTALTSPSPLCVCCRVQFIPVAFGIKKLRIICVVVDDLVSTDDLQEAIEALDGVQSTDIHAFNKL